MIPFSKAAFLGNELDYVKKAVLSNHICGDGSLTKACQKTLETILNVSHVLLTTSCTHALEMAGILLDLQPDDEVIVPSYTFVSTVNAFLLRKAKPVFIDIRRDTLNLDESQLESLITPRTKAIVPVHYGGVGCEMDRIIEIAKAHQIPVVEDNAHGLFGKYKGKCLGTFGTFATQSFHETKNITCGEGGALVVNDTSFAMRAEIVREKGTDRSQFYRGLVNKYTWQDVGSSYVLSDILAGFLLAQLEKSPVIQQRRKAIWESYYNELKEWAEWNGIGIPQVPSYCEHPAHLFYLLMPTEEDRDAFIVSMREKEIACYFHYLPLHLSPMGSKYGYRPGDLPVTEGVSERLIRLPLYYDLSDKEQDWIISSCKKALPNLGSLRKAG